MKSKKKKPSVDQDAKQEKSSGAHVGTVRKKEGVANPPRKSDITTDFLKDYTKARHSGCHDMQLVNKVMQLLVNNEEPLDSVWNDHELKGEWADYRELHIKGDLLLIYALDNRPKGFGTLVFVRLGSHSELFG